MGSDCAPTSSGKLSVAKANAVLLAFAEQFDSQRPIRCRWQSSQPNITDEFIKCHLIQGLVSRTGVIGTAVTGRRQSALRGHLRNICQGQQAGRYPPTAAEPTKLPGHLQTKNLNAPRKPRCRANALRPSPAASPPRGRAAPAGAPPAFPLAPCRR